MCVSVQFNKEDGSGSGFGSWKTVPSVPVPRSVPGKTLRAQRLKKFKIALSIEIEIFKRATRQTPIFVGEF